MNRFETTKKVGTLGIIGNIFLLIIKIIVGFISKSQAMIADAANSAGDIFASLMTAIGNKIASEPKDEDHNFGHGKAEYIFSLFISLSMMIISLKLLYDSVVSLIFRNELIFSWWLIIVCIVTICTKLALFLYSYIAYKKCNNVLIKSSMIDHRNDCFLTIFTTISILLTRLNIYWFDGIVGIGISTWIFVAGIKIFLESYNVLMDKSITEDEKNSITEYVLKYDEVLGVESIHSIPTGYKYIVVITINVNGKLQTFKTHEVADEIQEKVKEMFEKVDEVIVHVEPLKEK